MREIKFRGRGAPRGKQWFYGDLDTHTSGVCILDNDTLHTVISETVGQYTGLKDSEGREIYEGDILSLREGSDEMIEVIDFYAAITALDLSEMMNLRLLDYYFERGEVHVIGNLYDSPELLEATHD